jgi:hypothetical protein
MTGPRLRVVSPFPALGLDPGAELSDDDVLVAWRRIAAATHPDRADGGDPERFAAAAAAYTELRTRSGRGEARASLREPAPRRSIIDRLGTARSARLALIARLAIRVAVAVTAAAAGVLAAGGGPAGPALVVGALTWLVLGARKDIRWRHR